MKTAIAFFAVTLMVASQAWASTARMIALGQDSDKGSQTILDSRNIFHNPAYLGMLGNFAQFDFGDAGAEQATGTATGNAKGQGGFYHQGEGSFGYGVWLGNDSATASALRTSAQGQASIAANTFLPPDNTTEFLFAGKGSMAWGASLIYSSNADKDTAAEQKESSLGVRLGAMKDKWDVGLSLGLQDTASAKSGTTELKYTGTLGIHLTAGYKLSGNYKAFLSYQSVGGEADNGAATANKGKSTINDIRLGVGKNHEMESSMFFWQAFIHQQNRENTNTADAKTKTDFQALPIVIGLEAQATDWLTLRGSIRQNFFIDGTKTTPATGTASTVFTKDNAVVAGGASITFDKLQLDGVIAQEGVAAQAPGMLNSSALMTNLSLTYNW